MKRVPISFLLPVALAILLQFSSPWAAEQKNAPTPQIMRLNPRFDRLVPHDAVVETVADGFAWVEGPVWNRSIEGSL